MNALKWTLTSLVLLGLVRPTVGQQIAPGLQPPAPPAAVNPMGPMGNGPMMNPNSAMPGGYQGDGGYQGQQYGGYEGGPFQGGQQSSADYNAECPPVFDNVLSSPGTFFFRAEAFMLRRSQPNPNIALVRDGAQAFNAGIGPPANGAAPGNVVLSTGDLHFRNEVGQKFDAGYEFNECATIMFTFWEVQDWNPTNGVTSANGDLTLDGLSGFQSEAFRFSNSIQAQYRTMIKSYEINWLNATIYDRISLLAGFRYMDLIDRLALVSTSNAFGDTSDYIMRSVNQLLGGQIGVRVVHHIDLWSFEFTGKSGLYNDWVQYSDDYFGRNNLVRLQPNPAQGEPAFTNTLSAINELNLGFSRKLGNHVSVRAGYNAIWVTNVGLAADNFDRAATHQNQGTVRLGGDLFLYGVNVGTDLRW